MSIPFLLHNGPTTATLTVVLAHGAGVPMDSPFMTTFATGLAERGYRVARFEFPYMAERRQTGHKKPPDRAPVLLETWRVVIDHFGAKNLIIGGKSLGGRMASMVADSMGVRGLVCLGYPFHAPGKPAGSRVDHLKTLRTPALILQGTRDALGNQDDVAGYTLSPAIRVHWLADGDHDFKPRKASGRAQSDNWNEALDVLDGFLAEFGGPIRAP